jgi:hypothetical protein
MGGEEMKKKFQQGQVVLTRGAFEADFGQWMADCYVRHLAGDWGDLGEEDKAANEDALKSGLRLFSAYTRKKEGGKEDRIWIITEADRSTTTILLPEEY